MKDSNLPSSIKIRKGLNVPIKGEPVQDSIVQGKPSTKVALLGPDYLGLKPTMAVKEGEQVKLGQLLFTDKKQPGVNFTSPSGGRVLAINRGAKRAFTSIVIECSGSDEIKFDSYQASEIDSLSREKVKSQLIESGEWVAMRARPFSKIASVENAPHSIFVTAIDTNPLAADPAVVLNEQNNREMFQVGLKVLSKLTDGKVFACVSADTENLVEAATASVKKVSFRGPHPAGNAGTHIHFLDPVHEHKTVWHIYYQDVIAYGHLFTSGRIMTDRVISLAGPSVKEPRIMKVRKGAELNEVVAGELYEDRENRVISGSVLNGRTSSGDMSFLGRYHWQVSAVEEGRERIFLGWQSPGLNRFSLKNIYLSKLLPGKKFAFNTNKNGSDRAMVPIGMFEKVMPLDILPTHLLRSILVKDTEQASKLGALELDEEDLALCTFVCPGKSEYGPVLRETLTLIEKGE